MCLDLGHQKVVTLEQNEIALVSQGAKMLLQRAAILLLFLAHLENILHPNTSLCPLKVKKIANDGDCFYRCVATALSKKGSNQHYSVQELRKLVAEALSLETLENYQALAAAELEGYTWSQGLSLGEAKAAIRGEMERGPRVFAPRYYDSAEPPAPKRARKQRVVWADEWAINVVLEELNVELFMFQSNGVSEPFTRVKPLFKDATEQKHQESEATRRVLLVEKKPGHYNLLEHGGVSVYNLAELPDELAAFFGLDRVTSKS